MIFDGVYIRDEVQNYIVNFSDDIKFLFYKIRELVIHSVTSEVDEKMRARLPSYYFGDRFVRIIPFKDHINIEAMAIHEHHDQLERFKLTAKGMLQVYPDQDIPVDVLMSIFKKTLTELTEIQEGNNILDRI